MLDRDHLPVRAERWSETLVDVHVYLPDHEGMDTSLHVAALQRIRLEAEAKRKADRVAPPFRVGGYEVRVPGHHVYVKIGNAPSDLVERVRMLKLPRKTRIETRPITP